MTDVMLQRAVLSGARSEKTGRGIRSAYVFKPRDEKWREAFLRTDDAWLVSGLFASPAESAARKIVSRLLRRELTKEVFEGPLTKALPGRPGALKREQLIRNADEQCKLEHSLAQHLGTDPDLTFLDLRTHDNPMYRSPDIPLEEDILVAEEDGHEEKLANVHGSLCQAAQVQPEATLYVYAPLEEVPREDKQTQRERIKAEVSDELEKWFGETHHAA